MNHDEIMQQAIDLNQASMVNAEKRDIQPEAIMMAAANSLASCMATAATLQHIAGGLTPAEAKDFMSRMWPSLAADVLKQAVYKFDAGMANVDEMVRGFNEAHPEHFIDPDELPK